MSVREEFDAWAAEGRDRGMEDRHWHTAKHALTRMPVEAGDTVLDLGYGGGYAARALRDADDGVDHVFSMKAGGTLTYSSYSGATPTVSTVPSSRYRSTIASRVSKSSVGNSDSGRISVS